MDEEKLTLFKERGWGWNIQREGLQGTQPRGHDGSTQERELHPHRPSLVKALTAELVGLKCRGHVDVRSHVF